MSTADFPRRSFAAAVRSAPASMPCRAVITMLSCSSWDLPFSSSMESPTADSFSAAESEPPAVSVMTVDSFFIPVWRLFTSAPQRSNT